MTPGTETTDRDLRGHSFTLGQALAFALPSASPGATRSGEGDGPNNRTKVGGVPERVNASR